MSEPHLAERFPGVAFTPIEVALLRYLEDAGERYVPRSELLREVWGYSEMARTRTVETTVQRVRMKIETEPKRPTLLVNLRGRGYRLELPRDAEVQSEVERLRAQIAALLSEGHAVIGVLTEAAPGATLPSERDAFVGREPELDEAWQRLTQRSRWLTVHGGPGVGKTRFALRLGRRWLDREGEVCFVDLTEARDEAGLWSRLARALGVVAVGEGAVRTTVLRSLAARAETLLVLDNAELVVDSLAEALPSLLDARPDLRVLATSRESLRVPGEAIWELEPLDSGAAETLLRERLAAIRPDAVDGEAELADIVALLEGVPLAIELAAARARHVPLADLAQRLRERRDVLAPDERGRPPRHLSLDAAIAWSWDLLSTAEQRLLADLSVFRGGASFEALAQVSEVGERAEALAGRLIDKGLLVLVGPGPRVGCLESIRQFAARHAEREPILVAEVRHAAWFARRAQGAARAWDVDPEQAAFLLVELDNLQVAVERMTRAGMPEAADLIEALWPLVLSRGLPEDYVARVDAVLATTPPESARVHALQLCKADALVSRKRLDEAEAVLAALPEGERLRQLEIAAGIALGRGRAAEALQASEQAAALAERTKQPLRRAKASIAMGAALQYLMRPEAAQAAYREAVALAQELGAGRVEAVAWSNLGSVLVDPDARAAALARAEELAQRFGDRAILHAMASVRATQALERGDLAEADAAFAALFEAIERTGGRVVTGAEWVNAGLLSLRLGRFEEAAQRLREARRRGGPDSPQGLVHTLGTAYLAVAEVRVGHADAARELFASIGEAEQWGETVAAAVTLCRAHLPEVDAQRALAAHGDDPALADLAELLTNHRL
ncbi:MAG: hypothetical protein EP330_21660 [Deltaproteobacteria bacterium]|nr:MAG: hypothetical protein EP330_21660 [Deltaproteobacteria bacterium]